MTVSLRSDQTACSPELTDCFCSICRSTCRRPAAWGRTFDSPNCPICLPPSSPRPTGSLWRGCWRSVAWRWNIQAQHVPALREELWYITDLLTPFLSHTPRVVHINSKLWGVSSLMSECLQGGANVICHVSSTSDIRNVFSPSLGTSDEEFPSEIQNNVY